MGGKPVDEGISQTKALAHAAHMSTEGRGILEDDSLKQVL